ncbi:MAG: RluA family pseudouridine synthase [Clostridia bacterium]|nr:RluA family pseudouridine synthase [Clostridia bacterium]
MQIVVGEKDHGTRIDVFLSQHSELTRSSAQKLLEDGESVSVNGLSVSKNHKVTAGDLVELEIPEPVPSEAFPEDIPLDVYYEDEDLIVVNKPRGMVVHPAPGHPGGTLVNALLYHCGETLSGVGGVMRPGIVHRIDRDTSGLLVVAKNDAAHLSLQEQIRAHSVLREYEGIVSGRMKEAEGIVREPLARHPSDRKKIAVSHQPGARDAVTRFLVLDARSNCSYCRFRLETGRTHQIRVHMAYLGHPLLFDPVYGTGSNPLERKYPNLISGQCLHASVLGFLHPKTGQAMKWTAPLPDDFCSVLSLLQKQSL